MGPHQEIEATFEARPGIPVPDLADLAGVASADPWEQLALDAVYWDTPDLRLARAHVTLWCQTGGPDEGWRLLLPVASDEPIEVHAPLGPRDAGIPVELVVAVRAWARESRVEPVVTLRVARAVRRLRDARGRVLVEVADDAVTSRAPGADDAVVDAWREWRAELVHGDRELLASVVKRLGSGGGTSPEWASALARALGDRLVPGESAAAPQQSGPRSAGAVLRAHLRSRRDLLLATDPQVRRHQPDGVHEMSVLTRQLRAALATFRPLLVRERSDPVRVELGWLAGLLSASHDAEVARDQLADLVTQEPAEFVLGPVARRLDGGLAVERLAAHRRVLEALDSERYFRLLDALDALVDDPPLTNAAAGQATRVLPPLVRHDWERLSRAFRVAAKAPPSQRRDVLLHEAHKAATRVRYAAQAVAPVLGGPAEKFARATKDLRTLLGRYDDLVDLSAVLKRAGIEAALDGENAFTYGRLHAIERARAAAVAEQLPAAWERVSAGRRHRWMR